MSSWGLAIAAIQPLHVMGAAVAVQLSTVHAMEQTYVSNWILDLHITEERSFGEAGPHVWTAVKEYFLCQMYRSN